MVAERRLRAAALAGAAAAQHAQTSNMTEQDGTVPALTAQVHQFTQWVGELQQRLAAQLQPQQQQPQQPQQQQQQQRFLQGKELRIARFGGNRCHNLSDEINAVFGTRQANIAIALGWAERRDNAVDATPITIDQDMGAADNEALHANILVPTENRDPSSKGAGATTSKHGEN